MGNWCRSILLEQARDQDDLNDEQSMDLMDPYWDFFFFELDFGVD